MAPDRHKYLRTLRGIDFFGSKSMMLGSMSKVFYYGGNVYSYLDIPYSVLKTKKVDLDSLNIEPLCDVETWLGDEDILIKLAAADILKKEPELRPAYYISNEDECPDVKWNEEK